MTNHEVSPGRYYPKLTFLEFRLSPQLARALKSLYTPDYYEQHEPSEIWARSVVFLPSRGVGAGETLHDTVYEDIPGAVVKQRETRLSVHSIAPEVMPPRRDVSPRATNFGSNVLIRLKLQEQVADCLAIATTRPVDEMSLARFEERQERSRDLSLGLAPSTINRAIETEDDLFATAERINHELAGAHYRIADPSYPYFVKGHPRVQFVDQHSTRVRTAYEPETTR